MDISVEVFKRPEKILGRDCEAPRRSSVTTLAERQDVPGGRPTLPKTSPAASSPRNISTGLSGTDSNTLTRPEIMT